MGNRINTFVPRLRPRGTLEPTCILLDSAMTKAMKTPMVVMLIVMAILSTRYGQTTMMMLTTMRRKNRRSEHEVSDFAARRVVTKVASAMVETTATKMRKRTWTKRFDSSFVGRWPHCGTDCAG